MNAVGSVNGLAYVSLRTRDLGASIKNGVDVLGLRETESNGRKAYLTAQATHHEVVYTRSDHDAVDHIALLAANSAELGAIHEKVLRGGYRIVAEQPLEDEIEEGFAFVGPEGFTWQVSTRVSGYSLEKSGGYGPDRLGHVNILVQDVVACTDFLVDILDMRVSDRVGADSASFVRFNDDHHGIAVFKSERARLHHHAWETQSIVDLGRLGDRLSQRDARLAWGPVRHGAGDNIAAYHVEPNGAVIELYTDMERIFDRDRAARTWSDEDSRWVNKWDGYFPASILDRGVVPVER